MTKLKYIFLISLLITLMSCQMLQEVKQSTDAIHANQQAVLSSTQSIQTNKLVIEKSNAVIAANKEMVQHSSQAIKLNEAAVERSTQAILANIKAVELSSQFILKNAETIERSTQVLNQLKINPELLQYGLVILGILFIAMPLLMIFFMWQIHRNIRLLTLKEESLVVGKKR